MAQIQRGAETENGVLRAAFRVNINITMNGSKKMTPAEQEEVMPASSVRILVEDPATGKVLVDEIVPAKEFSSKNVGYGLQEKAATFSEAE